jgi:Leucine-rich repeat (LRR) protein
MSVPNSVELLFINNNHIKTIHANTFVDKVNLNRVDLYANEMTKLQLHQLRIAPASAEKALPEFYLGGNPFECDCSMEWLQRLNNLTSRQHPRVMDLPNIECIMPHSRGAPGRSISTLLPKDFLCKYETHCFALCHCCDFDHCDCEQTCPTNCSCYHDQTWNTNIVDCGNQGANILPRGMPMDSTEIYFDGNNFPELQNHAFIGRKNLRVLYVNASKVISIQNRTFASLPSLKILHLQNNHIQRLHGYEFETLSHLKELYLQNNLISTVANHTFSSLFSLEILRLDGNRLSSIAMWQMQIGQLQNLQALSLGRNPWSCRCKALQALTFFVSENAVAIQDSQDIYCSDAGVNRELDLNSSLVCSDIQSASVGIEQVISNAPIFLFLAILTLIIFLIMVIVFCCFRETLKLWLFAHYGLFRGYCDESEKLYDALFLHSAKDTEFVIRKVAVDLEASRQSSRFCLQHRDLCEDASYMQILETARASRRVVVVLTRNFLQTEWSRCELRRAVHESLRGRPQKLVIVEDVEALPEAESDIELLPYLKTSAVNRIRRSDRLFWEKLHRALPVDVPYRGNNYTIEHHHERIKQPISPGITYRQAPPPAYCPEVDEANYSSATTATPSPRPQRRGQLVDPTNKRPTSEHIYSSIDSDYSTLDCENNMNAILNGPAGVHRTLWRNTNSIPAGSGHLPPHHGHNVQAYLV